MPLFDADLIQIGLMSRQQVTTVLASRDNSRPRLGELARNHSKLNVRSVFRLLGKQHSSSLPFDQLAVSMGLLDSNDLGALLREQHQDTRSFEDILVKHGLLTRDQAKNAQQDFPEQFAPNARSVSAHEVESDRAAGSAPPRRRPRHTV